VLNTSADSKRFETFTIPVACDPMISARCEIDLSPGILIVPTKFWQFFIHFADLLLS
jgi:hypothetical protein